MQSVLAKSDLQAIREAVQNVHFYGAACSSTERNAKVASALVDFFADAKVSVDQDMMAAARATCGDDAGLVCILGTGSNVARFDGARLEQGKPSMGYLLGDEGSGMHIGRCLLRDYYQENMPPEIAEKFSATCDLDRNTTLEGLYENPKPNAFMASFAPFAVDAGSYGSNLVKSCFREFVKTYLLAFPDANRLPVHFVGSIAFHFANSLQEIANEFDFTIGKIIQKPIFKLGEYHANQTSFK